MNEDYQLSSYTSYKWTPQNSRDNAKEKATIDMLKRMFVVRVELIYKGKPLIYTFKVFKVNEETIHKKIKVDLPKYFKE
jgi:hypothetical protein